MAFIYHHHHHHHHHHHEMVRSQLILQMVLCNIRVLNCLIHNQTKINTVVQTML